VKIAHLDTGVDPDHPALRGAIAAYAEFDPGGRQVSGGQAHDTDLVDGHGTHTAATIAGRAVRGRHVGVAPGAALCAATVIEGGDLTARILAGMEWAVTERARVVSLSLGIRGYLTDFLGLIEVLRDSGVLPVVAVGNEGPGTSRSPGNYPRVLSVGYYTERDIVADDSSSQRFPRRTQPLVPDLVAPGDEVVSAAPGGGWRRLSGSSMAVPHVTGLAALLLEAHPAATVSQLERAIQSSAQLGTLLRDRANRGAVNAARALAALNRATRR
jgi:subtilisin family serine protease